MGTDIFGWIECWQEYAECWGGIVRISSLSPRNYDLFASLFGERNDAKFRAIAPNRGLPHDVSREVQQETANASYSWGHSWITWDELYAIDPDEEAEGYQTYTYRFDTIQGWQNTGKHTTSPPTEPEFQAGQREWKRNDVLYRAQRPRRGEGSADPDWQSLMQIMQLLAHRYGGHNVRMVIWFGSSAAADTTLDSAGGTTLRLSFAIGIWPSIPQRPNIRCSGLLRPEPVPISDVGCGLGAAELCRWAVQDVETE